MYGRNLLQNAAIIQIIFVCKLIEMGSEGCLFIAGNGLRGLDGKIWWVVHGSDMVLVA